VQLATVQELFAAQEEPGLFSQEVRAAFKTLR
jgi:hypothetical protein